MMKKKTCTNFGFLPIEMEMAMYARKFTMKQQRRGGGIQSRNKYNKQRSRGQMLASRWIARGEQ